MEHLGCFLELQGSNLGATPISNSVKTPCTLEVEVDYFLNGFSLKTIVLVGIYNQQFKGTILFMVFDFQGALHSLILNPFKFY